MKTIIKNLLALIGGGLIGLLIAGVGIVCLTDTTFTEYIENFKSLEFGESIIAVATAILAFILSFTILIPLHESGHLVCGLLSGYRFVSFRIFSFTIIRIDGKIRIKRFAISGTGGQCLLNPPELPLERIPTAWYNFGGVFFNILAVIAALPLLWVNGNPFIKEATVIFLLTGVLLVLMNGIPMKISGAGNDAYNMVALRKNMLSKRGFIDALRANALIQNGVRPKDMPDEWFTIPSGIDYKNQLEVSIPLMAASRLIDESRFADALHEFESLYEKRNEIIGLYVKEIACELVFLRLVCGNIDGAEELLDDNLKKYINTYRKMMSSKERILCAISLIIENDKDKALGIYTGLKTKENRYLLQGEVKSDLAIMGNILRNT